MVAVQVLFDVKFKVMFLIPGVVYTSGVTLAIAPVAGLAPAPKFQAYVAILSGAAILEVLFNTTLLFKQALPGVNVAVGNGFTLTTIVVLSLQPLFVVALNSTV